MGYIKGKVTKVHVGDPQEPKQEGWSKSARFGLQIDGKWWNGYTNQDKQSGAFPVKDKEYTVITEGLEVEFMTKKNTDDKGVVHENMDKKTLQVTGGTQQAPPIQQNEAAAPPRTPPPIAAVPDEILDNILWCRVGIEALIAFHGKELPANIDEFIERKVGIYKKQIK